jgi:hypothetical protein
MNERMIELYKEASEFAYKICREEGREGGTQDHIWNTLSTGKFAELIVRECADLFEVEWGDEKLTGNDVGYVVKKHFGVE